MQIELYIFTIIIILYGILITKALIGFNRLRNGLLINKNFTSEFISIVVSARNEEQNISKFVSEICKQNFPKNLYELIFIDDASEDNTYKLTQQVLIASNIDFKIIKQDHHKGKKYNLSKAIELAKGSVIVTTDADVVYRHPNWLISISNYFSEKKPNMLIMPIDFKTQHSLLTYFQIIENVAITAITAGFVGINEPFLCNGANLAFRKSAYLAVSGYQSHLTTSSGDDVLLLEDLKKIDPASIHYCLSHELIVKTVALRNIKEFIYQRIRWANKIKINSNYLNLLAGFVIVLANLLILALPISILLKSEITLYLVFFVLVKFIFDFLLLFLASSFLNKKKYIWMMLPFECIYWAYAFTVGVMSLFIKPKWKGKKVN